MKTLKLNHFSGSTINDFIERRDSFYRRKVLKTSFNNNPSTARGKAVEAVVNHWFEQGEVLDVHQVYKDELGDYSPPDDKAKEKMEKVEASLMGLASLALDTYKSEFLLSAPTTQMKIESRLEGVNLPFIGFLDYYEYGKQVRDCKVVGRNMSELSQAYKITGSLYRYATGVDVFYDLFVDNKKPVHNALKLTEEDYRFGLSYARKAMQVIEELLTCEDTDRFFELMCFPNLDSYYDKIEQKDVADSWGIEM